MNFSQAPSGAGKRHQLFAAEVCGQTSAQKSTDMCLKFVPADRIRALAEVHC